VFAFEERRIALPVFEPEKEIRLRYDECFIGFADNITAPRV
jgi:hypothetical protein